MIQEISIKPDIVKLLKNKGRYLKQKKKNKTFDLKSSINTVNT